VGRKKRTSGVVKFAGNVAALRNLQFTKEELLRSTCTRRRAT
jgi:hypothetical protein